ncbi:MAG: hypothetical protein KC561_09310, partial [Myxococcales bacterium]|nr:hypothetical protein [Myxococcales bacterium]
ACDRIGGRVEILESESGAQVSRSEIGAPRAAASVSSAEARKGKPVPTAMGLPNRGQTRTGRLRNIEDPFRVLREPDLLDLDEFMVGVEVSGSARAPGTNDWPTAGLDFERQPSRAAQQPGTAGFPSAEWQALETPAPERRPAPRSNLVSQVSEPSFQPPPVQSTPFVPEISPADDFLLEAPPGVGPGVLPDEETELDTAYVGEQLLDANEEDDTLTIQPMDAAAALEAIGIAEREAARKARAKSPPPPVQEPVPPPPPTPQRVVVPSQPPVPPRAPAPPVPPSPPPKVEEPRVRQVEAKPSPPPSTPPAKARPVSQPVALADSDMGRRSRRNEPPPEPRFEPPPTTGQRRRPPNTGETVGTPERVPPVRYDAQTKPRRGGAPPPVPAGPPPAPREVVSWRAGVFAMESHAHGQLTGSNGHGAPHWLGWIEDFESHGWSPLIEEQSSPGYDYHDDWDDDDEPLDLTPHHQEEEETFVLERVLEEKEIPTGVLSRSEALELLQSEQKAATSYTESSTQGALEQEQTAQAGETKPEDLDLTTATKAPTRKPGKGRLVAVLLVALIALGGVAFVVFTVLTSGQVTDLRPTLISQARGLFPSSEPTSINTGLISASGSERIQVAVAAGHCSGFIAGSPDSQTCDLSLDVTQNNRSLFSDRENGRYPAVFYCAEGGEQIDLVLANSGSDSCRYAVATFDKAVSSEEALPTYLDFVAQWHNRYRTARWVATDEMGQGILESGHSLAVDVSIPANSCRTYIAVSRPNVDLNSGLIFGEGEDNPVDISQNHFPMVGACAQAEPRSGQLILSAESGGDFAWRAFEGRYSEGWAE